MPSKPIQLLLLLTVRAAASYPIPGVIKAPYAVEACLLHASNATAAQACIKRAIAAHKVKITYAKQGECSEVIISGQKVGQPEHAAMGTYKRDDTLWTPHGPTVYKSSGFSDRFLFFDIKYQRWIVGVHPGRKPYLLSTTVLDPTIKSHWKLFYDGEQQSAPNIKSTCEPAIPSEAPTRTPTVTPAPTLTPTLVPTSPTSQPTQFPTVAPTAAPTPEGGMCSNNCEGGRHAFNGECDDGGPNSDYSDCPIGTDCHDCGTRYPPSAFPTTYPSTPPSPHEQRKTVRQHLPKQNTKKSKQEIWRFIMLKEEHIQGSCVFMLERCLGRSVEACMQCAHDLLYPRGSCEPEPTEYYCQLKAGDSSLVHLRQQFDNHPKGKFAW